MPIPPRSLCKADARNPVRRELQRAALGGAIHGAPWVHRPHGARQCRLQRSLASADDAVAVAVFVASHGGLGAGGGDAKTDVAGHKATGGDAPSGGVAGAVTLTSGGAAVTISTGANAEGGHAVLAESIGGQGGKGGDADAAFIGGSQGGNGGAGTVNVDLVGNVSTRASQAQAVYACSFGGSGGEGGNADAKIGSGKGGAGAGSAPGGDVGLTYQGSVTTASEEANALMATSVGGFSGSGGSGSGFLGFGAGSQSAGDGGNVTLSLTGTTVTT